jgi:hypothetical protein
MPCLASLCGGAFPVSENFFIKKCEKGVDMGLTLCYDILESRV